MRIWPKTVEEKACLGSEMVLTWLLAFLFKARHRQTQSLGALILAAAFDKTWPVPRLTNGLGWLM